MKSTSTRGFFIKKPIKLDNFRAVGVKKLVEDKSWESTITNTPRFVTKVVHEFCANLSDNIVVQGKPSLKKCLLGTISISFPLE